MRVVIIKTVAIVLEVTNVLASMDSTILTMMDLVKVKSRFSFALNKRNTLLSKSTYICGVGYG